MNPHILSLLKKLEQQKQSSDIGLWNVSWEVGKFLHQLVFMYKPKTILEIGTSNGFSALWMASAASVYGGEVYTIESSPKRIPLAKEHFKLSGLDNIFLFEGHAPEIFPVFGNKKFEMIFIDATKKQYFDFFHALQPYFADKVLLLADNILSHPEPVQEYLDTVRNNSEAISVCLPFGAGIEMTLFQK